MLTIRGLKSKIICPVLAFVLCAQSPAFALLPDTLNSLAEQKKQDLNLIDYAYTRSNINAYEENLNKQTKEEIDRLLNCVQAQTITELKEKGISKYGNLWPAYVRLYGQKEISKLTEDFMSYLGRYFSSLQIMPYELFEKQYIAAAEEEIKNKFPNKNGSFLSKELSEILQNYPAVKVYADYKDYAAKEIQWRKDNSAKTNIAAVKVIKEYFKILSPELLSAEALSALNGIEIGGKAVLNKERQNTALAYHNLYLAKQNLKNLDDGLFTNEKERKIAAVMLEDIAHSIMSGAMLSGADKEGKEQYRQTVKNLIEHSEKTAVFSEILAVGMGGLAATESWAEIDSLLGRYTKQEQEGPSWYEYMDLNLYAQKIKKHGGYYLGKVSSRTHYTNRYSYQNVFTDIAKMLGEDGSKQALSLLHKYGSGMDIDKVIKPFLAGELLSKSYGANKEQVALELANLQFNDITATEEYDLDTALLLKYPAVKDNLSQYALVTEESLAAKRALQNKYGYLERAAVSGDIIWALCGAIGLFKIGVKAASLTGSAYTAVKTALITGKGRKIVYFNLDTSYLKVPQYVDTDGNILKLKDNIRSFLGKKFDYKTAAKLDNNLNTANLARAGSEANPHTLNISLSAAPGAKTNLSQASYKPKAAQLDLVKKYRKYNIGNTGEQSSLLFTDNLLDGQFLGLQKTAGDYHHNIKLADKIQLSFGDKVSSVWLKLKNMLASPNVKIGDAGSLRPHLQTELSVAPVVEISSDIKPKGLFINRNGLDINELSSFADREFINTVKGSVFQIFSDTGHGTGFYLDYKGAKFIATSAHVLHADLGYPLVSAYKTSGNLVIMPEAKLFKLTNAYGRSGKAVLVYQKSAFNHDLALLVPEPSLVKDLTPFKLALLEPPAGTNFVVAGYPGNEGFTVARQDILGKISPSLFSATYYLGIPGLKRGFSGAPLLSEKGILGIAVRSDLTSTSYYIQLPIIKEFINYAFKDLFLDFHFNKAYFFKNNPELLVRYKNIIGKYHYMMNSSVTSMNMPYPLEMLRTPVKLNLFTHAYNIPRAGSYSKKLGFSLLKNLGFTPKKSLNIMYGLGTVPEHSILPKLSNAVYNVDNLRDFVSMNELMRAVPFPKFYSRHNIYKGIALSADELKDLFKDGLTLDKYGTHFNSYFKYSSKKSVLFTDNAAEAFSNSIIGLKGGKETKIPVVLQMRNKPLSAASDIPFNNFSRVSVLLDVNGMPAWGDLTVKNGLLHFIPYM